MKFKALVLSTLFLFSSICFAFAASPSEDVVGYWRPPTNKKDTTISSVKLYIEDGVLYGKFVLFLDINTNEPTDLKDTENKDDSLKGRDMLGVLFVEGFTYNEDKNQWVNGNIYDPRSGNIYHGKIYIDPKDSSKNTIRMRGSIDKLGVLGKTDTWTRITDDKTLSLVIE